MADTKKEHYVPRCYLKNFILENDNPVGDGDTISGLENGELDSKVQWTLPYEDSLVQPVRAVLDVNMGEYASGTR